VYLLATKELNWKNSLGLIQERMAAFETEQDKLALSGEMGTANAIFRVRPAERTCRAQEFPLENTLLFIAASRSPTDYLVCTFSVFRGETGGLQARSERTFEESQAST
jgi:hypothetical protein